MPANAGQRSSFAPIVSFTASKPVRAVEAKGSNNERQNMKQSSIILALALGVSACYLLAQDQGGSASAGNPPPHFGPPAGFHLLPPRAMAELNLTDDQKKQLADLETEVKVKIEKILTPEQLQQLKQMRPPMRPGMGRGPGGPPSVPGGQAQPQQPPAEQQ